MTPEERLDRIETQIEKQNKGIQDLIRLSGIFLDQQKEVTKQVAVQIEAQRQAQKEAYSELRELQRKDHEEWTAQMKELRDVQADTEQKLNILIDTVDRIIRNRNDSDPGRVE